MAIIREFHCPKHGDFEGTHPICPGYGCDSSQVERAFRTPVGISKGLYARFDAGLRESAERMGIRNFKTVKGEEVSFGGRAAQENKELGQEVLWGDQVKKIGMPMDALMSQAAQPFEHNGHVLTQNSGIQPGNAPGQGRLPAADIKGVHGKRSDLNNA